MGDRGLHCGTERLRGLDPQRSRPKQVHFQTIVPRLVHFQAWVLSERLEEAAQRPLEVRDCRQLAGELQFVEGQRHRHQELVQR